MYPKYLNVFILTCLFLITMAFAAGEPDSVKVAKEEPRFPPLPENYRPITINGVEYVSGVVFLSSMEDTVILKEYKFDVQFVDSLNSVNIICRARWPKDMELDSLPKQVLEIRYTTMPKNERPRRRIDPPPKDFPFFVYKGVPYASGWVLIESDKDTTLLKEFGFCDFNLRRVHAEGIYYDAMWPKDLPWDSLPPQLIGVRYDDLYKR